MKIIFICSSIEPGLDGVGDYTRRLAAELIKSGNEAAILSLNDRHLADVRAEIQLQDEIRLSVMRIPGSVALKTRIIKAKEFIDQINPEWLSLQFVPFGFHPKGLTFGLSKQLQAIASVRKWHIMFHELWVGIAFEESLKLLYWGMLQRYLIKSLLSALKPAVIHTQTHLYQFYIQQTGFEAGYLPLFGNIPVPAPQKSVAVSPDNEIVFVVFGLIHSGAPIDKFAREAAAISKKHGYKIKLKFIGRCGMEQERWINVWKSNGLNFEVSGEQSPEQVSETLSASTMGISATAFAVIEKSGSVAAMRDHGLPVLSLSKPWTPRLIKDSLDIAGVFKYIEGKLLDVIKEHKAIPVRCSIADISNQFLQSLSK